nr:MAG: ORF1 [TTV-like mini virus]UGV34823.1 MAG: ORF1 [TTV-like mini virus]
MPWRRWRRRRWYRRPRNFYWRPRKIIRRRYRRRRVRIPKKLKRLHITQWQPSKIRQCNIKGLMCLFLCNKNRLGHNLAIYNNSIVPQHLPGGGGFSIYQFTLENLYTMHEYCRNWWTQTNNMLPLVRYVNCTLKIYQSEDVDIVFRYNTHPPLYSTQLTYPSMQPSMLMLLKNSLLIPSKKTHTIKKGYRKLRIHPPNLMQNKWYFQQDLSTKPLLVTHCVAASFDHYYISTQSLSNNATVPILNTALFQNRHFDHKSPDPYHAQQLGTQKIYLYATYAVPTTDGQVDPKELILLGESKKYTPGLTYTEYLKTTKVTGDKWQNYLQHINIYQGNPFHNHYLNTNGDEYHTLTLYQFAASGTEDWTTPYGAKTHTESQIPTKTQGLVELHNPFVYFTRYNPNSDNGSSNKTFLLPNFKPEHGWDPPSNTHLILEGFPLYIQWWGFVDFQKQQHEVINIDTSQIFATNTDTLHGAPQSVPCFVPLNQDFIEGRSPHEPGVNQLDINRWYPMVQHQELAINNLLASGPGTAKLNGKETVEAKMAYTFRFKFGGNPPPMVDLKDPTKQPVYPMPNNNISTNSLQDPTISPELFLYNFDQRRDFLTKQATERMQKYQETKKPIFTDATTTPGPPAILHQTLQTSEDETSDSEKEEEEILNKLLKQRKKQQQLKQRIRQLLAQHNTNI